MLVPFVLLLFIGGAVASLVIAQIEDAPARFPSAWLMLRAIAAGWLILATWAALGVLLGVLTRGTSLAIGIGILYALVIEGLLSAFADSVSLLEPLTQVFLRAERLLARHGARRQGGLDPGERARRLLRADRRQRAGARGPRRVRGGIRGHRRARPESARRRVSAATPGRWDCKATCGYQTRLA